MKCYGCDGKGWVDSQYKGPTKCPICGGGGSVKEKSGESNNIIDLSMKNKNMFLARLEESLQNEDKVKFGHENKSMNTYTFVHKTKNREVGLVWVSTIGAGRIYLFKADYALADPDKRVKYEGVWGGYPQFEVSTHNDVEYAIKLIKYTIQKFSI